jgi:rare lipoprotein A
VCFSFRRGRRLGHANSNETSCASGQEAGHAKKTIKLPKLPPPSLTGIASVYRYKKLRRGASGEILNFKTLIAAHRTFRFGTRVKATNHKNGKSVVVRIIDRGPFIRGRVIDLSPAAAREIGLGWGIAPVTLAVVNGKKA